MSDRGTVASARDHTVSVFARDGEAIEAIARYVADGLDRHERVIVVMTPEHVAGVDTLLRAAGHDVERHVAEGTYAVHDALTTLTEFVHDEHGLDPARTMETIGSMVAAATADGRPVRLFGEMVALLWERGDVSSALALETLWGVVAQHHAFSLFCAYPTSTLGPSPLGDVRRMCELHTELVAPVSYLVGDAPDGHGPAHRRMELFLPTPSAVRAARGFVGRVIGDWGLAGLADDAALVSSELATNAVSHAGSPFRVSVLRRGDGVRIAIEDAGEDALQRRWPHTDDISGRGVAIVDAVSDAWGSDPVPGGKVIWADLGTERARRPA